MTAKEVVHGVRFEDLSELSIDQVIALVEEAETETVEVKEVE
jgi:hypothetical protein